MAFRMLFPFSVLSAAFFVASIFLFSFFSFSSLENYVIYNIKGNSVAVILYFLTWMVILFKFLLIPYFFATFIFLKIYIKKFYGHGCEGAVSHCIKLGLIYSILGGVFGFSFCWVFNFFIYSENMLILDHFIVANFFLSGFLVGGFFPVYLSIEKPT